MAGPESGYAWQFDRDVWQTTGNMKDAANDLGPWNRIQYPGSQIGKDQPGLESADLGYAGVDASSLGWDMTTPLSPTLSLTDTISPKAIRWSVGMLLTGRSEYVRVTLKVSYDPGDPNAPYDANGCFEAHGDVIGGDAGGEQGGKDHLWRYYDPTDATLNPCSLLVKRASKDVVPNGEIFQYLIEFWNAGSLTTLTNVVIQDTLPGEVSFISAFPAQDSGPNPLVWTIPSIAPGEVFSATVTVQAKSSGVLALNNVTSTSDEGVISEVDEGVWLGANPVLILSKSVTPPQCGAWRHRPVYAPD